MQNLYKNVDTGFKNMYKWLLCAITTLDKNSLLAQHGINLEGVEIIDRSTKWKQRLKKLPAMQAKIVVESGGGGGGGELQYKKGRDARRLA